MLVDSHCHLDRIDLSPYGGEISGAVAAANDEGVTHMLCVCISEENKDAVFDIAAAHAGIFASVGVHPSDVKAEPCRVSDLLGWVESAEAKQAGKLVAIGETGLDYYYSKEWAVPQQESFKNHLRAASTLKLPVIVHTRDAREDTINLIKQHGNLESAGVLHCFTESWEMAKQALDLNYYISLSGIVTFKNAEELREVGKKVPLERLLIETDSPYLAPVPFRGKKNEPRYVKAVAEYVAELRGITYEALAEATAENFFTLFNRARP